MRRFIVIFTLSPAISLLSQAVGSAVRTATTIRSAVRLADSMAFVVKKLVLLSFQYALI